MKLTIYYGHQSPIKCTGKNQCPLMEFAYYHRGWHTFKNDRATKCALLALTAKGYIETSGDQFRFLGAHKCEKPNTHS